MGPQTAAADEDHVDAELLGDEGVVQPDDAPHAAVPRTGGRDPYYRRICAESFDIALVDRSGSESVGLFAVANL